ncbi:MAG: hypothetical protein NTV34_09565, partial [Proteobacteria bacterium]|nr:hypothetical protein [Pseudomonadota bacterium]
HDVVQSRGFKSLPAVTKAEYLAATRQYDAAVKQYEHILVDRPLAKIDPEAWGQAMRKMLAITVRVKNNANLTLEMISKIQDSPESIVPSLRLEIADWRQAAKSWSEEKPLRINTDEARYLESKRLFDEAEVISAKTSGGGLIQYLRATALLHEMLGRLRGGENYQNMLWLAGRSAKSLKEFNLWAMQDIYFESCVRSGTDKVLSGKCYTALEESALESYGVVSRSGLPAFMRARLDALKPK